MLDDERIMSRRASREGGGRDYAGRKGEEKGCNNQRQIETENQRSFVDPFMPVIK